MKHLIFQKGEIIHLQIYIIIILMKCQIIIFQICQIEGQFWVNKIINLFQQIKHIFQKTIICLILMIFFLKLFQQVQILTLDIYIQNLLINQFQRIIIYHIIIIIINIIIITNQQENQLMILIQVFGKCQKKKKNLWLKLIILVILFSLNQKNKKNQKNRKTKKNINQNL